MFRITPGVLILGLLALLLALFAAIEVRRRLAPPVIAVVKPPVDIVRLVPVAARDLEPDRPLTEGDIGTVRRSDSELERTRAPADFMGFPKIILGRVLRQPLPKGAYFTPDSFYSDRMGKSLADRLLPGFRAVTIPIEGVGALDGNVVPGSMVDVIFRNDKATNLMPIGTFTVVSDVQLLALGDNTVPGSKNVTRPLNDRTTATLAVPVDKANRLKVVEGRGTLSLLIRSPDDRDTLANNRPETLESLMGVVPPKGPFVSQIYRRGKPTTLVFDNNVLVDRISPTLPSDLQFAPTAPVQVSPLLPPGQPVLVPQGVMVPTPSNPPGSVIIPSPVIIPTPVPITPVPLVP